MLAPQFEAMPSELRALPRWLVWKGAKVPYCAAAVASKASVSDPSTWATFQQAQAAFGEGGYDGAGFVLNGDGVAGIDLDKCAKDGTPAPEALAIMRRAGCRYIEVSPSGTGLRGFGYASARKGRRGRVDGVAVELYSQARFLSVTGHVIEQGPLAPLDFDALAACMGKAAPTESTEENRENRSHPSVLSVLSVGIPAHTIPATEGERNFRLFELARWAKGMMPNATREELRALVLTWHEQALPVIGTKPFATSWSDFLRGWEGVKFAHGASLASLLTELPPLPPGIADMGYGDAESKLVRVCLALARIQAPAPFFISARQAGELTGLHFTDAAKVLTALRMDGVIELVSKGAGTKASRYLFTWNPPARELPAPIPT